MAIWVFGEALAGFALFGAVLAFVALKRILRGVVVVLGWVVEAWHGVRDALDATEHLRR